MDVEFVTGTDTEDAFVEWCARRRRETVPPRVALAGAAVFAFIDLKLLWHRAEGTSVAFLVASACQLAAAVIAVRAYDGERERPLPAPHAEVGVLALFALSLVVSFVHRPSLLALMLLALMLTAAGVVVACCRHALALVRRFAPSHGRAEHVHIGTDGIDITVRPEPRIRHVSWRSVRYLGADGRALFIVAGVVPGRRAETGVSERARLGGLRRPGGSLRGRGAYVGPAQADQEACSQLESALSANGFARVRSTRTRSKASKPQCARTRPAPISICVTRGRQARRRRLPC